eukprot:c41973_g1_i1 orf=189-356(+)
MDNQEQESTNRRLYVQWYLRMRVPEVAEYKQFPLHLQLLLLDRSFFPIVCHWEVR